jgi:peptidoglycan/LPS O-acetylase OafA/YrhL
MFEKYLAHFWTLAIEEQFYLLVAPILLLLVPRRSTLSLAVAFIVTGVAFRAAGLALGFTTFSIAFMMPAQADVLGMGALLAVLRWQHGPTGPAKRLTRTGFLVGLPLTIACCVTHAPGGPLTSAVFILENVGLALLFVAIIECASSDAPPPGFQALKWAPLVFVGRISYGVYVYHFNVPGVLRDVLFPGLGLVIPDSKALAFLLYTAVSIAIAAASFYFYEQWFNRLRDSLTLRADSGSRVSTLVGPNA